MSWPTSCTPRCGTATPTISVPGSARLVASAPSPVHAVVLDANGMSDIDYTGLQALRDLVGELSRGGVALGIARSSHLVHHNLKHGALLQQLGPDHLFTSVEAAVAALQGPSA